MRGHCCCCCCINLFIQTDKILLLLSAVSAQCSDVLHEYGHRAADTILGLLNKHLLDNNQCYEHARGAGHGSCSGERPRLHPHPSPNSRIWLTAWAGQRGKMARWQAARWHLPLAPGWPVLAQEPHCRNNHHTVPALPSDPLTLYIVIYPQHSYIYWHTFAWMSKGDNRCVRNEKFSFEDHRRTKQWTKQQRLDIRYICFMTNFQQLQNWCRILNVAAVVLVVAGAGEVLCTE